MTVAKCESCGREFDAKRSTAKYCSDRCRQRAHRRLAPLMPDEPITVEKRATMEEVLIAVSDARKISNRMVQLSRTAPRPLRPGCERIGEAIALAIAKEEW